MSKAKDIAYMDKLIDCSAAELKERKMKTKLEQKLIIVYDIDTDEVNRLLNDGWTIKSMSACGFQWAGEGASVCYVHLVRGLNK